LRTGNENRWEKNLKSLGYSVQQPSTWCGRSEQILLNQVGCEARKRPAVGDVCFLDFYLYRTYRDSGLPKERKARSKKQEARSKKQEARSKKQEARSKKQEAPSMRIDACFGLHTNLYEDGDS